MLLWIYILSIFLVIIIGAMFLYREEARYKTKKLKKVEEELNHVKRSNNSKDNEIRNLQLSIDILRREKQNLQASLSMDISVGSVFHVPDRDGWDGWARGQSFVVTAVNDNGNVECRKSNETETRYSVTASGLSGLIWEKNHSIRHRFVK